MKKTFELIIPVNEIQLNDLIPEPLKKDFLKDLLENYFETAERYNCFPELDVILGEITGLHDNLFNYDCSVADGLDYINDSYSQMERRIDEENDMTTHEEYLYMTYEPQTTEAGIVVMKHYNLCYDLNEDPDLMVSPIKGVW